LRHLPKLRKQPVQQMLLSWASPQLKIGLVIQDRSI
jgi:hypothetical protein